MALFVTRSTRVADETGPTAPIITATASSSTSVTVNRTTAATDISGILNYTTQRSAAGANSWTTIDVSSNNPVTATGLTAGTSYDFRQFATDTVGNVGTISSVVTATTQGGSSNILGVVGPYASHNLQTNPISTFSLDFNDYVIHQLAFDPPNAGTHTHFASGWPVGNGAFVRLTPPTGASQDIGVQIANLNRGGAIDIQEYQWRYQRRFGPTAPGLWGGAKGDIAEGYPTNDVPTGSDGNVRPILFWENYVPRANTLVCGIAQGTVQMWGAGAYATTYYPPLTKNYVEGTNHLFYIVRPSDPLVGGTFQGSPVISGDEVLTFEHKVKTTAHGSYPNGFHGLRVYRQNGTVLVTCLRPWRITNDLNETAGTMNARILRVQQFGCGQHNGAHTPNAGLYMDVGTLVTDAINLNALRPDLIDSTGHAWLGPVT